MKAITTKTLEFAKKIDSELEKRYQDYPNYIVKLTEIQGINDSDVLKITNAIYNKMAKEQLEKALLNYLLVAVLQKLPMMPLVYQSARASNHKSEASKLQAETQKMRKAYCKSLRVD